MAFCTLTLNLFFFLYNNDWNNLWKEYLQYFNSPHTWLSNYSWLTWTNVRLYVCFLFLFLFFIKILPLGQWETFFLFCYCFAYVKWCGWNFCLFVSDGEWCVCVSQRWDADISSFSLHIHCALFCTYVVPSVSHVHFWGYFIT